MPYKDLSIRAEKTKERRKKHLERNPDYFRSYYLENKQEIDKNKRLWHVKQRYNLDANEYLQMILDQNNKCKICNQEEDQKNKNGDIRPLCVDHCHITGIVRGLLCNRCNSLLGHSKDNIETLENAIKYLKENLGAV